MGGGSKSSCSRGQAAALCRTSLGGLDGERQLPGFTLFGFSEFLMGIGRDDPESGGGIDAASARQDTVRPEADTLVSDLSRERYAGAHERLANAQVARDRKSTRLNSSH